MPKTQPEPISPPVPGPAGAANFAGSIQRDFVSLFQDAHDHRPRSAMPGDSDGVAGDVALVKTDVSCYLAAKSSSGWYVTPRLYKPGEEPWDDLRFPATGLNPPGAVSDPGRDNTDGCFVFDAASTELITGVAQMPHAWKEGSVIRPHIHWAKTTSATGAVVWQFEYAWANLGEVSPTLSTPITGTLMVSDGNTVNKHALTSFGSISGVGKKVSSILKWRLTRVGGDGGDTYGADAKLLEFDIHYQVDSSGSTTEYVKQY